MLLYEGCTGPEVKTVQERLAMAGHYLGLVDGIYGPVTKEAVIKFQKKRRLNADGVVGPKTRNLLNIVSQPKVTYPLPVPNGLDEIMKTFGDPLLSGFWEEYGDFCETPSELDHIFTYTWNGKHGFWCHRMVVIPFQTVYQTIVKKGLKDKLNSFDGCYNCRKIRGSDKLSTHSWGIAVDHNARTNPLGAYPMINQELVKCFTDEGFVWGGSFSRQDGMHFQFAEGY